MDDLIGGVVRAIAKGELAEVVAAIVAKTPPVMLPGTLSVAPTKDHLAKVAAL